ncbi:OOP family OmpA-OmpF porin [Oxalobacteraceae bacterium GrIS 1.11]
MRHLYLFAAGLCCAAQAQQVVISGTVPDEAGKAAVLLRLRQLYGAEQVLDQITVGNVALPVNWNTDVQKLINPNLKLIKRGQLTIDGNSVSVRGEVASEAQRRQIASAIASSLNPSYTVNNGLRVVVSEQGLLDATLDKRSIEFELGKTSITSSGKGILDEMAGALQKLKDQKVELIGHTDNTGVRDSNLALSRARAEAVRAYLAQKGIDPALLTASGKGPDSPLADNGTADGRARNRRIEFHIVP